MSITPSNRCHSLDHFSKVMIFTRICGLFFSICLMTLCTPIPTVLFLSFSTWGFHSYFVEVRYIIGGPIWRNIVYFNSPLRFLLYNNNPSYLCFPFIGEWYAYNDYCIRCGSYFFTIAWGVFNIRAFSATNKVCNLVSIRVGLLYINSFWLSYSQFEFLYFGHISGIQIIHWIIYS